MDKIRLDAETHFYWFGKQRVPGYSEIVKDLGVVKENPFWTPEGREEGIAIHKWMLHLAQGKTSTVEPDPRIAGRVAGIRKFIKDTGFKIVDGEIPIYDPLLRYACTPDLWGFIEPWSWVIECKRGAKLPSHRLQTMAQLTALRDNGFRIQKRGCLYLKDGDFRLEEHTDHRDRANWGAIVTAYWAKKEYV